MLGVYAATAAVSGVSGAKTLMYITSPADAVVEILEVMVTNASVDNSEQHDFSIARITSLGTPTATAVTPAETEEGSAAAGSTVAANVTASEPTYAAVPLDYQGVSGLAGYQFFPPPEGRVYLSPSTSIGVRILSTPTSAFDARVQIKFREIGG